MGNNNKTSANKIQKVAIVAGSKKSTRLIILGSGFAGVEVLKNFKRIS
jgi:hypothetical protein